MIVDVDGPLEKSEYFTNLRVDSFRIAMEKTGGYYSWINVKSERYNRIIHNMVRKGILDSNQQENKWFCEAETSAGVYI